MASAAPAPILNPAPSPSVGTKRLSKAIWFPVSFALLIVAALMILRPLYRFGINETDDSAVYLSAAQSPAFGTHLTTNVGEPPGTSLTHYPPLYPMLLAGGNAIGTSFLRTAAIIDFVGYIGLCAGVCWFVSRYAPPFWALVALALVLCSGPVYYVHSLVGPDGAAISLMTLAMCFLSQWMRRPTPRTLVLCGIVLAVAILLRYVCLAFIGASCLTILVARGQAWNRTLTAALRLGALAFAPLACVLLLNTFFGGTATDRSLHFHPVTPAALRDMVDTLAAVFLPYQLPLWLRAAVLALFALLAAGFTNRQRFGSAIRILGIFLVTYLAFVLVSISFFDAATPLNERILAPAVALMSILLTIVCCIFWERGTRLSKIVATVILLMSFAVGSMHAYGLLKTSAQARSAEHLKKEYSAVLPAIDALPKGAIIYTNVPFDIYLVTGRNARTLPRVIGYTDLRHRPESEIEAHVIEMRDEVAKTGGVIAYRVRPNTLWDAGLLSQDELRKRITSLVQLPGKAGFVLYSIRSAGE